MWVWHSNRSITSSGQVAGGRTIMSIWFTTLHSSGMVCADGASMISIYFEAAWSGSNFESMGSQQWELDAPLVPVLHQNILPNTPGFTIYTSNWSYYWDKKKTWVWFYRIPGSLGLLGKSGDQCQSWVVLRWPSRPTETFWAAERLFVVQRKLAIPSGRKECLHWTATSCQMSQTFKLGTQESQEINHGSCFCLLRPRSS